MSSLSELGELGGVQGDKRCIGCTKVNFDVLTTPEKVDKWMKNALRKNALSQGDKRVIEELVSYFKRNFKGADDVCRDKETSNGALH